MKFEVKEKEKPQFVGGGRGGVQNRRKINKPSPLGIIPESYASSDRFSLYSYPELSISSCGPLVTFTPDLLKDLETFSPIPSFTGGGRGGWQNRTVKDMMHPSRADRSGKSSSNQSLTSVAMSLASVDSGVCVVQAELGEGKAQFIGGGRGGMQNRKMKDMKGAKR